MEHPTAGGPARPPSKLQVFLRRALSTVLLWGLLLAALFSGREWIANYVFLAFILALALAGLNEFYALVQRRGLLCFKWLGLVGALVLMIGTFLHATGRLGIYNSPARANDFETGLIVLLVLGVCVRQLFEREHSAALVGIATTLLGLVYVPWLLNFIQKINFFPGLGPAGRLYVLYFVLVTKFSDTGAYVVGSLCGRHKLVPRISPAKTWEGFAGAIVIATATSVVFADLAGPRLPGMNLVQAVVLGLLLGGAAVIGDLIESLFKREAGVKDSGRLFPGIGGVLDLLDSLLFNAPIMYLYLRHVLTRP